MKYVGLIAFVVLATVACSYAEMELPKRAAMLVSMFIGGALVGIGVIASKFL